MTPKQIQVLKVYQQRKAADKTKKRCGLSIKGESKASKRAKKEAKYGRSQNTITSMLSATKVVAALL